MLLLGMFGQHIGGIDFIIMLFAASGGTRSWNVLIIRHGGGKSMNGECTMDGNNLKCILAYYGMGMYISLLQ